MRMALQDQRYAPQSISWNAENKLSVGELSASGDLAVRRMSNCFSSQEQPCLSRDAKPETL